MALAPKRGARASACAVPPRPRPCPPARPTPGPPPPPAPGCPGPRRPVMAPRRPSVSRSRRQRTSPPAAGTVGTAWKWPGTTCGTLRMPLPTGAAAPRYSLASDAYIRHHAGTRAGRPPWSAVHAAPLSSPSEPHSRAAPPPRRSRTQPVPGPSRRCAAPTRTTTTSTPRPFSTPSTTASAASRPTSGWWTASCWSPTTPADLDPARTLESLYLDPLSQRVRANRGRSTAATGLSLQLLIDIKTAGEATYLELAPACCARYRHAARRPTRGPGPRAAR